MTRSRATAAAILILLVAAAALLWRSFPGVVHGRNTEGLALEAAASGRFQDSAQIAIDSGLHELSSALSSSRIVGDVALSKSRAGGAYFAFLAEYLRVRAAGDPGVYSAWAASHGLEIPDTDPDPEWTAQAHRHCFQSEPPERAPFESFFAPFYECHIRGVDGRDRPTVVATGHEGATIWFARVSTGSKAPQMPPSVIDDPALWYGQRGLIGRKFWRPKVGMDEIIQRDGSVLVAHSMIGVLGAGNAWYVLSVTAFFDPTDNGWLLDAVSYSNTFQLSGAPPY